MAFFDPGVLRDGDLSLVPPTHGDAPAFLRSVGHPGVPRRAGVRRSAGGAAGFDRRRPARARAARPAAERLHGGVPTVDEARLGEPSPARTARLPLRQPPVDFAGTITLRIGRGENVERYLGHLGYLVFPAGARPTPGRARLPPAVAPRPPARAWPTCGSPATPTTPPAAAPSSASAACTPGQSTSPAATPSTPAATARSAATGCRCQSKWKIHSWHGHPARASDLRTWMIYPLQTVRTGKMPVPRPSHPFAGVT